MDINSLLGLLSNKQENQVPMSNGLLDVNLSKYENLTSENKNLSADYKPLNFDSLLKSGALRVTHQANSDGSFNPDPKAGFSLVSAYNDVAGEQSKTWKDNPMAYDVVKDLFMNRPTDIGSHKYLQIIQSAKDLGLKDSDIFLNR